VPDYLEWCRSWVRECARVMRAGATLLLYGSPAKL